jgi:large subunit ribosomal protein L4
MMDLPVIVPNQTEKKSMTVLESIFGCEYREALIHQVVTAFLARGRAGTKAQKTRAMVSGGGRKPYAQKKTGRARAGSNRSPIWRGGGVIFADTEPRDFSQKVNKKMYRGALRSILSELIRQNRLKVVESLKIAEPKTRLFNVLLKEIGVTEISGTSKVLFITDELDRGVYLASRNLPFVEVRDSISIDPVALVKFKHVIVTVKALKDLEERLR